MAVVVEYILAQVYIQEHVLCSGMYACTTTDYLLKDKEDINENIVQNHHSSQQNHQSMIWDCNHLDVSEWKSK